jgi:hypothetical protein
VSESPSGRRVTAAFGAILLVLAVVTVATSGPETRAGAIVVALVLAGLGIDALFSAARGRRSLVSRIGPLP